MTRNDKTGAKLVESMRRTKAAAADKSGGSPVAAEPAGQKSARRPTGAAGAPKRASGGAVDRVGDPYQSGRRVWPD